jgi:hypothetical protein
MEKVPNEAKDLVKWLFATPVRRGASGMHTPAPTSTNLMAPWPSITSSSSSQPLPQDSAPAACSDAAPQSAASSAQPPAIDYNEVLAAAVDATGVVRAQEVHLLQFLIEQLQPVHHGSAQASASRGLCHLIRSSTANPAIAPLLRELEGEPMVKQLALAVFGAVRVVHRLVFAFPDSILTFHSASAVRNRRISLLRTSSLERASQSQLS